MGGRDKLAEGSTVARCSMSVAAMAAAARSDGDRRRRRPGRIWAASPGFARRRSLRADRSAPIGARRRARAGAEVVLIHDAARPLATPALADRGSGRPRAWRGRAGRARRRLAQARRGRRRSRHPSIVAAWCRTQTPQGARRELLAAASTRREADSSRRGRAVRGARIAVASVPARRPTSRSPSPRTGDRACPGRAGRNERLGFGEDVHPFGPEMGLRGGTLIRAGAPAVRPFRRRRRAPRDGDGHPERRRPG